MTRSDGELVGLSTPTTGILFVVPHRLVKYQPVIRGEVVPYPQAQSLRGITAQDRLLPSRVEETPALLSLKPNAIAVLELCE